MVKKLLAVCILLAACTSGANGQSPPSTVVEDEVVPDPASPAETPTDSTETSSDTVGTTTSPVDTRPPFEIPSPPPPVEGAPTAELTADLEELFSQVEAGFLDIFAIENVADHGDPRAAWIFTDLLRFVGPLSAEATALGQGVIDATGVDLTLDDFDEVWKDSIDTLIAWDLPALPEYADYKRRLFTAVEPGWAPFFADPESEIDWRWITWGGVFIDDRPLGEAASCPRGCIPALDDPLVTDAAGGSWYPDDGIVFGITVNGESRAYPKHQMETHEMVNDTLGGERLGIPYCTLCGSAQAYLTAMVPAGVDTPVLRTSGLLSRSNKVMYDLVTGSVFDTFTGDALSGSLREAGVSLPQTTVVASTWGAWKEDHPDTTILAEDGGIGASYRLDPLRGRDDDGPIFPVGDVDPRLPVQALVVGVELADGRAVAFPREQAVEELQAGRPVEFEDLQLRLDGSGLRVTTFDGTEVAAHEAFWFAWSQFWEDTELWQP